MKILHPSAMLASSLASVLLFGVLSPSYGQFTIADDSTGAIVIEAQAPDSVRLAAQELKGYLQKITGATVDIKETPPSSSVDFTIYLGDTDFAKSKSISTTDLKPDGFRILADEKWMVISGKDYSGPPMTGYDNPYRLNESYNDRLKISTFGDNGTLHGVYHFLREVGGIRWYMPGLLGEVLPEKGPLKVEKTDLEKHPEFQQRFAYFCFFSTSDEDALWYKRAGFGAPFPAQISHSFGKFFLKYKDTNPEYFALINGERDFTTLSTIAGGGNLNLSNPDLIQQAIKDIIAYFDENPEQRVFPLGPNDGMVKISEDPVSQAQIDLSMGEDGKFSNYVWGFINEVAKGVGKVYPDRVVGCIAYESYNRPPSNIKKLEPNVAVVICRQRRDMVDPQNEARQEETLKVWAEKASVIYTWEYYCEIIINSGWRGYPVFYPSIVKRDIERLKGISRGEFIEAESWSYDQYADPSNIRINYPGLQHPLLYLTSRLLWEPGLDDKALLKEYYERFYGPASAEMQEFWETAENAWLNRKGDSPSSVFFRDVMIKMIASLDKAKALTTPESVYRKRITLIENEFSPAVDQIKRLSDLKIDDLKVAPINTQPENATTFSSDWRNVKIVGLIDRSFQTGTPPTHVRFGWSPESLLISITCYEPKIEALKAKVAPGKLGTESLIWEDDSVEIFLQAKGADTVYHFIANSNGALFDQSNSSGSWSGGEPSWESGATVLARKDKAAWTLELAIPWTSLRVEKPESGLKLIGNVYRNRLASGFLEQFSWTPLHTGTYYAPENFGTLTLTEGN